MRKIYAGTIRIFPILYQSKGKGTQIRRIITVKNRLFYHPAADAEAEERVNGNSSKRNQLSNGKGRIETQEEDADEDQNQENRTRRRSYRPAIESESS